MERENGFLSDRRIKILKDKLLSEKERICNRETTNENYCLDRNELSDPLDEASINVQASQEIRFRNRENFYLRKINKSLEKIEKGIYGLCDDCDGQISFERLSARPTADLCITCKEDAEHTENNNFFQKRSKSLGKTISELGKR